MKQKIDKILELFLIILMTVLVLDVLWQVFSRYVLTNPSSFTDELAGFLLIWLGLFGAAFVTGANQHLAIDILHAKLNNKNRKRITLLIQVLIFTFSLTVMIIGGIWLVISRFYLGQISAAIEIPLGYVYLVLPVSGILICYYSIQEFITLRKES
ncbi:TRAP transporter small permease [Bacteroidota bacterium]